MYTLKDILLLSIKNCFFVSNYLNHAYFSVPVCKKDCLWFKFTWNGELWQFTSLPQGFSSSPRLFTKLFKVPFLHFQAVGILAMIYIDDCLMMANSKENLKDVRYIASTLDELGFIINLEKSEIEFLGFVFNSKD